MSGPTFNWPKASWFATFKQNTWHADVSFAAEPTDAELDALGRSCATIMGHVRAVNSHEALVKAFEFIRDGYDNQDVNHVDFPRESLSGRWTPSPLPARRSHDHSHH